MIMIIIWPLFFLNFFLILQKLHTKNFFFFDNNNNNNEYKVNYALAQADEPFRNIILVDKKSINIWHS